MVDRLPPRIGGAAYVSPDDVPVEPGGLTKNQALNLLNLAAKSGIAPEPRHLEIVYGKVMSAEILSIIRRKQEAAGRAMAQRIAVRNGESRNRVPSGPTEVDIEAAIREALAEMKSGTASEPQESPQSENLDPRALAEAALNSNRKLGGRSGHYFRDSVDADGWVRERIDSNTHMPIGVVRRVAKND